MGRTVRCTPATRQGRLRKARQFAGAAEVVTGLADDAGDVADAYVTLLVHAGIAAADVLCCPDMAEIIPGRLRVAELSLTQDPERPDLPLVVRSCR